MWIPAVGVRSGGGGCSRRFLGAEDADVLSVVYIRLHGGSLSLAALHLLVFLVGVCWARRRAVSGSCGTSSGRTEENLEERSFTFKSFWHLFVIFYSFRVSVVLGDVLSLHLNEYISLGKKKMEEEGEHKSNTTFHVIHYWQNLGRKQFKRYTVFPINAYLEPCMHIHP